MNLTNIASKRHKCKILHVSSSDNNIVHPIQSIISEQKQKDNNVWISGEGLPQQIIFSFEDVEFQYHSIKAFIFNCSHDYQTNPKIIEIWVAKNHDSHQNGQWIFWEKYDLKKKRGKQMFFTSSNIPESLRFIKIVITQTFGQFHTYLNQIMILAEPDPHTSQSLFNNEEWQKQKKSLQQNKKSMQKSRTTKNILYTKSSGMKDQDLNDYLPEHQNSPLQLLKDVENFQKNKNRKKGRRLQLDDIQDPTQEKNQMNQMNQSIETDTVLLAMSKNILIMEDNIEELKRKFQVIEKKVQYTFESFQSNILRKVQEIVKERVEGKFGKKEFVGEVPRRLRSCKDLTTSRTMNKISGSRAESKDRQKIRDKQKQKQKYRSKYNEAYDYKQLEQKNKQKKVMSLVAELNNKLKQRTKLANKLQKRLKIDKPKSEYYD